MAYPFLDFITKFRYKDCRWVVERDFHGNFWVNFKWTQGYSFMLRLRQIDLVLYRRMDILLLLYETLGLFGVSVT